ncbi:MAG: polysaccharide deacetylase family protein, partial [Candidatus Zixiibacteriota bacterium]
MNICFFAKAEKEYEEKIRYVVNLFFSTYGVNFQLLQSLDQICKTKPPWVDLLLFYGSLEDYQKVKDELSPICHLLFMSRLFQQVFDPKLPEVKGLKREGTDFSLPILYAYASPMQKSLYLVEEKSGRKYPGITVGKIENRLRIVCYADLFASSYYLLTLQEEKRNVGRQKEDRFLGESSWREKENIHHIPLVNHYFKILFELLQMVAKEEEIPLISKKLWPSGSNLAVVLTHDVDILDKWSLYVLFRICVLLKRGDFKALIRMLLKLPGFFFKGNKSLRGINFILDKEKKRGYKSTFFFLTGKPNLRTIVKSDTTYPVKKAKPAVERILDSQGEIGLHGSLNSYLDKEALREEKGNLEKFLSSPGVGIRQHFLYLRVPQTWRYQSESGFLYDCTLSYPDRSGFRSGFALPFRPYDVQTDQEIGIWEMNTNVMDQTYDKYDRKGKQEIKREIEKLLDQVESANGGLLTLLWHTNVLEELGFPDFLELYGELLEGFARRKAFVSTGEGIARFWIARKEVKLLESKVGKNSWKWRYQASSLIEDLTF